MDNPSDQPTSDLESAEAATLARAIGDALRQRGWTIATAESCTGGLVGTVVTNVPGSSAYYLGGVIAYANDTKVALLGVPPALLAAHGAVSGETAEAMARGMRERLGADVAISTTGIAGPDGGSTTKPVGLVFVGLATAAGSASRRLMLHGDRAAIRTRAAQAALAWVLAVARSE